MLKKYIPPPQQQQLHQQQQLGLLLDLTAIAAGKKSGNFLTFFCCGKAKEVVRADPNLIKVELGSSFFGCFALESG